MKTIEEFAMVGEDSIQTHLNNQNYARVLELLETEGDNYPEFKQMITFKKIQMAAVLGDKVKALTGLQNALDNGTWYTSKAFEPYGTESPAIPDDIYNSPEFVQMLDAHEAAWQKMIDSAESVHATIAPKDIECPSLVVGFHGNTSSGTLEILHYQPLTGMGYRVVMPQSAQLWAQDRYVWGDWANTEKQVAREWQLIQKKYTFASEGIITAGMSKGGEVAVWSAMSGTVPAVGVITLGMGGPMLEEPQKLEQFVSASKERNLSFYFLVGTEDTGCLPPTQKTSAYLKQQGLRVHLEIAEGLGHSYPQDVVKFWNNALAFIKG